MGDNDMAFINIYIYGHIASWLVTCTQTTKITSSSLA